MLSLSFLFKKSLRLGGTYRWTLSLALRGSALVGEHNLPDSSEEGSDPAPGTRKTKDPGCPPLGIHPRRVLCYRFARTGRAQPVHGHHPPVLGVSSSYTAGMAGAPNRGTASGTSATFPRAYNLLFLQTTSISSPGDKRLRSEIATTTSRRSRGPVKRSRCIYKFIPMHHRSMISKLSTRRAPSRRTSPPGNELTLSTGLLVWDCPSAHAEASWLSAVEMRRLSYHLTTNVDKAWRRLPRPRPQAPFPHRAELPLQVDTRSFEM